MEKVDILINNGVLVNESLEFWGDMDSYNESLKEFNESLNDKLKTIDYYKNNKDCSNYAIIAHSMKSEAKYLGFMDYAEVFLEHELKAKENDIDFINNNYDKLKETVNKIKNILDEYFKTSSGENKIYRKNILIADDSNIMLNFIEHNLTSEYQVLRANNGKDAINQIESNNIYAIMLDINMPNMNGFEVLEYLKEHDLINKIPVVIITGDDSQETIQKAFTYQILDVVNKPFKEDNIKRVLVEIDSFYEKN